MNDYIKKYSKNLDIVRQCENFLGKNQRRIHSVDPNTNLTIGRIETESGVKFGQNQRPFFANLGFSILKVMFLIICSLLKSVKIDFSQKKTGKFSRLDNDFVGFNKNLNKANKKVFCDINFMKILKFVSLYFYTVSFFAPKISLCSVLNVNLVWLLILCFAENILFRSKNKLESLLKLDLNFVQRVVSYKEPSFSDDCFKQSPNKLKNYESHKTVDEIKDTLEKMRIFQNLKKEFVLKYFYKNSNGLSESRRDVDPDYLVKKKVVSGHWNEKMMRKQKGRIDYLADEEMRGRVSSDVAIL